MNPDTGNPKKSNGSCSINKNYTLINILTIVQPNYVCLIKNHGKPLIWMLGLLFTKT